MVDLKRVEAMFWRNLKLLSECTPSSPVTPNVFELLEGERELNEVVFKSPDDF